MKRDSMDVALLLASALIVFALGYNVAKGHKRTILFLGILFVAVTWFAGKHATCPECREKLRAGIQKIKDRAGFKLITGAS